MHERFEGTGYRCGGIADASSVRTDLYERKASIVAVLRGAWHRWREAREARARETVLLRQLRELDARMLDDLGIPVSRIPGEPSGSAMSRAIEIEIRDRLQRRNVQGRASPTTDDDVALAAAALPPLALMPENAAFALSDPAPHRQRHYSLPDRNAVAWCNA